MKAVRVVSQYNYGRCLMQPVSVCQNRAKLDEICEKIRSGSVQNPRPISTSVTNKNLNDDVAASEMKKPEKDHVDKKQSKVEKI